MIPANQIRLGMAVLYKDKLWRVVSFHHHTPGNLRAMVQYKLKGIGHDNSMEGRWRADETLEVAYLETKNMEYLYEEHGLYVFMDQETYEMVHLSESAIEEVKKYLVPNTPVLVEFHDGAPIGIELPATMVFTVVDTEPPMKGATASGSLKPATLDNGVLIKVPAYIEIGEKVKVDTRDDSFIERAS